MSVPHSLEPTLRRHAEAVDTWLGGLHVDYGAAWAAKVGRSLQDTPILRIIASPDRASAELARMLVEIGWLSDLPEGVNQEERASDLFSVLPLPLLSIVYSDQQNDPVEAGVPKLFPAQAFDSGALMWEEHPWPAVSLVTLTITSWSSKRYTDDYIREWFHSQFGKRGAAHHELVLPVQHAEPWGEMRQSLRLDSDSDNSDLEGPGPRYFRRDFSLTLRMLHFRPSTGSADYVAVVVTPALSVPDGIGTTVVADDLEPTLALAPALGLNAFRIHVPDDKIPTEWPVAGNAKVARGTKSPKGQPPFPTLRVEVTGALDEVLLSNRAVPLGDDGQVILSVDFDYSADEIFALTTSQAAPADDLVWALVRRLTLPAFPTGWAHAHVFLFMTQPVFSVAVSGGGLACVAFIANTRIRRVMPQSSIPPSTTTPSMGGVRYEWLALAPQTYLIVLPLVSGSGMVVVENDATIPNSSQPVFVDAATQTGAVFIMRPRNTTLALTLPAGLVGGAPYVRAYAGGYEGSIV